MREGERAALLARRLGAVRTLLDERRADAVLFQARRNVAWLTAGGETHVVASSETGVAALLVTRDQAVVLTAVNEAARITDEELAGLDLEVAALPWEDPTALAAEAERRAGSRPLSDADLEPALMPHRCLLAEVEHERMAWLAQQAMTAARGALDGVGAGTMEHAVAAAVAAPLMAEGVRVPVLLVAADDRIDSYRHPLPTQRRVHRRLMLVVVAERWGLHVALTRFVDLERPSPQLERRIAAARSVHAAMVETTVPGRTLGEVLASAQAVYADAGCPDEWRLHHQGGIIGYQGRERIATPNDGMRIERGMAFAWNPSITGAKAEETILLDGDRPRSITA